MPLACLIALATYLSVGDDACTWEIPVEYKARIRWWTTSLHGPWVEFD